MADTMRQRPQQAAIGGKPDLAEGGNEAGILSCDHIVASGCQRHAGARGMTFHGSDDRLGSGGG